MTTLALLFLVGLAIGWVSRAVWDFSVEMLVLYREQMLEIEDDK